MNEFDKFFKCYAAERRSGRGGNYDARYVPKFRSFTISNIPLPFRKAKNPYFTLNLNPI